MKVPNCPTCNVRLARRTNPRGGTFYGCPHFVHGCSVSYSPTAGVFYGVPGIVARSSKNHGRTLSKREETIRILAAFKGLTQSEAEEFLDTFGLIEVQKMLAA